MKRRALACLGALLGAAIPLQSGAVQQGYNATVARVRVDVIVTDDDGRFIDDLQARDFTVYDDGVPQDILELLLVTREGVARRVDGAPGVPAGPAPDSPERAAQPPSSTPVVTDDSAADHGALVFVIDALNSGRRSRARFAREWAAYQMEMEGDVDMEGDAGGVPRAAYLIDELGRLHELAALTHDPGAMVLAAERVLGEPIVSEGVDQTFMTSSGTMQPFFDGVTRAARTFHALTAVCDSLAGVPGRKALIWMSDGLPILKGSPGFAGLNVDRRIGTRQQAFHEAANTAGVSVYTIDPALITWRGIGGSASSRRGPVDRIIAEATGPGALRWDDEKDALVQTARATGASPFLYARRIDEALRTIEEDTGRYYVLTYATPAPLGDGLYHEVRVEVANPQLNVRARAGYLDLSAEARHRRLLDSSMRFSMSLSDLAVVAGAYRRWDPLGQPVVQVAATAFDRQGAPEDAWDWFHAVAFDERGWAVDQAHIEIAPDPREQVARAARADPAAWPFFQVHDLALPPGTHHVSVALADEDGGRIGATELVVEVRREDGWQTSDLILAARPDPDSPLSRPLVDGRARVGELIVAYLEVRGGLSPTIAGVLRTVDGTNEPVSLGSVPLSVDTAGIHRGALVLQTSEPGSYVLEIAITDPELGESTSIEAELFVVR